MKTNCERAGRFRGAILPRRSRSEILADAGDIDKLPFPAIDTIDFAHRATYAARCAAVRLWWALAPEREIKNVTGLSALAARRLVERAILRDPITGRMLGLHVCVPGFKNPRRKKPVRRLPFDPIEAAEGRGRSGVLADCFAKYPDIHREMVRFSRTRCIGNAPPVAMINRRALVQAFHSLCRAHGLDDRSEWPYDTSRKGENAIWEWYSARKWDQHVATVRNELGDEAGKLAQRDQNADRRGFSRREGTALDRLELDEHRAHSSFELSVPAPGNRFISIGCRRPWALAAVDHESRVCMSSALSVRTRYDTNDVKRLLVRALQPQPRYNLTIENKNFCYSKDAAYPAEVPGIGPRLWRELALDADASHLSAESLDVARQVLHCNVVSERVGEPTARSCIEGYFAHLAAFIELLPASTGTGPQSPSRRQPENAAVRYHLALPLAEELLDVYCRNWNARPNAACGGVSPLTLLQDRLVTQKAFDKPFDENTKVNLWKLLPRYTATLTRQRGSSGPWRINFSGKYGSRELADHPELRYLRDRRIHLYVQEDARYAHAVPLERPDLVFPVMLLAEFNSMPHTLEFRKACRAARKNEGIAGRADDPQLIMGVLQGLGEAAKTQDAAEAVLAGVVSFMNRHGLGNEQYINLAPEVRDHLAEYAARTEVEPDDSSAESPFGASKKLRAGATSPNIFGNL
ncbi:hypothetical protein [Pelomonas sp. KK5]|uniref:hypothetical protein n=1 Tax=Pelomonas sp. KK5 TaxID=1855730 RepID=UPI00117F92EC|nr:hypothetical protein [Pelomonas sp. KK5]